jgi:hypothetical protein
MLEIHDFHRMHNDLSLYSRTAPRIRGWSPTNEEVKLVVKMARIAKKHGYEGFADIYRMAIQLLQRNKWYGSAGRVAMEIRDYALAFSFFQKEGSYLRALNLSSQLGLSARLQCALQKKALVQRYYLELEAYDGMNRPKTTAAALADRFGMQKVLLEMYMRDFRLHNAKELAAKEGQDLDYILALRQHQDQFRQLTVPELRRLSLSLGEKHAYPVELLLEILALPRERIEKVVDLLEVGMNVYRAEQEPVIRLRREFPAAFEGSAQFSRRDALHVVLMEYWIRPGQNLWSEFGVRDLVEFGDVKRSLEELAQAGSLLSSAAFGRFLGVDYSSFSMPVQRRLRKLDPEQRLAVSLYIEYLRSLKEQSG